ncbi:MAG TPA: hypothetical protein VG963_19110 [Polyangiaceae bacterium]|nr:hypothetical protein [Polyangiaceae bacterium]
MGVSSSIHHRWRQRFEPELTGGTQPSQGEREEIVINTAARTNTVVLRFGKTLRTGLRQIGRKLVTLWVINRQRDALDQLEEHLQVFGDCETHVVRNGYFAEAVQFELYNGSKLRARIEKTGGRSLLLPNLADRVADDMYIQRIPISRGLLEMPIGNRCELERWRDEAKNALEPAWS